MEFVIEFDNLACSTTEGEVVRRRWEMRKEGCQHKLAIRAQFRNVEVELRSDRIGASNGKPA